MTILFQAKFLVLTFITLTSLSVSSNEILVHTEPNHYELFRINEESYRLSIKNPKRYGNCEKGWRGYEFYKVDKTRLKPVLDKVCQEYNFSSSNSWSYREERLTNDKYRGLCDSRTTNLGVYLSCKKKVDPVELAKKLKQKEADRLAYKKEQEKKELKKREAEALQKRKEEERKRQRAEKEKKRQQAIIELESKKITIGMGSGFWFNTDGYFATNHHVIQGCRTTQVKVNNELVNSKIISFDKINDLAIGKIDKNVNSVFSLSSKPELGEEVMVGGFPLSNVLQNDSIKITRGIVSSLSGSNNNYSMLQIDAPIQPGNSGGPIINSYGEVIGVATSYLRSTKEFDTQNVNFGVKVNLLRNMSESLGINVSKPEKQKAKNSKQLAKVLEKNTVHVHCTNTYKEWVALQNNQESIASLSEHIKLNLKDYIK
jgi:hypothetical protein